MPFIDGILTVDQRMPRKQRHTARRISGGAFRRTCPSNELPKPALCEYVRGKKKQSSGLNQFAKSVFCKPTLPARKRAQSRSAMQGGYNLYGVQVAVRRCWPCAECSSAHRFTGAIFRATQQAFLEAHELAFAYFGGVSHTLRYDNLNPEVNRSFGSMSRRKTEYFIPTCYTLII